MIRRDLSELRKQLGNVPIDVFLCSASFESRCRSIVGEMDPRIVRKAYVAYNQNLSNVVRRNLDYLQSIFDHRCCVIALRSDDPIFSAWQLGSELHNLFVGEAKRVVVDTTTFTRESLLMLLNLLATLRRSSDRLEFLYVHAGEYSVGDAPEQKWLSKGVREVRSILGYPGKILPSRRSHLIVLVGFENERALGLIRQYEPFKVSLGFGDSSESGSQSHHETNVTKVLALMSSLGNVETFKFKAYDVAATRLVVESHVLKFRGFNTIIAPMHTKISALSVAGLALERVEIQLCYAQVNKYNVGRYSVPGNSFYSFDIEELFTPASLHR